MTIGQISNGEKGLSVRTKLNENTTETNKIAEKMVKVPAATENNAAIFDALGQVQDAGGVPLVLDISSADPGDKIIVNELGDGITPAPSTTSSGFYDVSGIVISWDIGSLTLSLTGTYDFVTASGKKFSKVNDSIVISEVDGAIYVYYDNDGNLQQLANPNRDQQYSLMLITLPVSYFLYSLTFGDALFIGDYMKRRTSAGLWVKNFFDVKIDNLTPLLVTGLTGGTGSIDADAQFGLSESELIFVDRKYNSPTRASTDVWNVGFVLGSDVIGIEGNAFPVLVDTDLAIDTTGRILYNNGGSPMPAGSGNYVWYFLAITNDIEGVDRTLTFMGENEYGTTGLAEDALQNEVATAQAKVLVKQGFNLKKAVLYETKSTFANAVKGRIEEVLDISTEAGGSPSVSVPDDLINGSDASSLHNHNSLYSYKNIIANQGVDLDANKPVIGLTIGDVFVSNDTYLKYIATGATTWGAGEALKLQQIITDSLSADNHRYQYGGSVLLDWGSTVVSTDFIRFSEDVTVNTTLGTQIPDGYEIQCIIATHISGGDVTGLGTQFGAPSFQGITTQSDVFSSDDYKLILIGNNTTYPSNSPGNTDIDVFADIWGVSATVRLFVTLVKIK